MKKYYETTITPSSGGFGEWQQNDPNSEGWNDESDLVAEMLSNEPDLLELGVDELPESVRDIRGSIHNQAGRIFALPAENGTHYFAVVAYEDEDLPCEDWDNNPERNEEA